MYKFLVFLSLTYAEFTDMVIWLDDVESESSGSIVLVVESVYEEYGPVKIMLQHT